ncbi:urease accessory protein UreF [Aestuariivita sp.]|uniref:urease accessory protein UreF n=1 Tax=Aestuariivita sp. TaxID=1872407 RepID=UPI00216B72BE|nr:urease accessory protein UreF [Aestuariivita sp.]MCE8009222.1 urease accessory protein UreF [Aestuariivita sp.]
MPTDLAHLTLMQWLSPAYPVGAFAYSHGLEHAVSAGDVVDCAGFEAWLEDVLAHGAGRSDAILLHAAYHATGTARLPLIDDLARALCPSSERRMETDLQGEAFAATTAAIWNTTTPPATYPVAVGAAARLAGIDPVLTAASFLHAFAANLTSAAIRLIPLGQTEGQKVLARMAQLCQSLARETADLDTEDIGTSCFAADIASMQHEIEYTRLFRS